MRNPQVENMLYNHPNLVWEYREDVPVSSIDRKKSHANQARISEPLIADKVNEYTEAVRAGNEFPAIVCYEDSDNVLVNVDGNHRTEAFLKAKKETTDAYVVLTTDPLERLLLTYECNPLNGIPTSEEDRVSQAINLVHQGFAATDAAERLHIRLNRLYEGIADYNGQLRARGLGVQNPWSKIEARRTRVAIQNGISLDKVFVLVVQFCSTFQITTADTKKVVTQVKEISSEGEQLTFIRAMISQAEVEREKNRDHRGAFLRLPSNQVRAHLSYWAKVDAVSLIGAMTSEERVETRAQVYTAIERLQKMLVALN